MTCEGASGRSRRPSCWWVPGGRRRAPGWAGAPSPGRLPPRRHARDRPEDPRGPGQVRAPEDLWHHEGAAPGHLARGQGPTSLLADESPALEPRWV